MLSSQRRDFEDKKKDECPYPQDFARWNALDYFRRPRTLRARRFYLTLAVTLLATLASLASFVPGFQRVHQAGPVSQAHAALNRDCSNCHDRLFQPVSRLFGCEQASVSNQRCRECHEGAAHHAKQAREPECASCHREHLGQEMVAKQVPDRNCTACHGELPGHLQPGQTTAFHGAITNFHRDHPEFQPAAPGKRDGAKIKFNHKAHLDLDLESLRVALKNAGRNDLAGLGAQLACADCHQMDAERRYVKPIVYENHCARCHALNAALVGDFAGDLRAAAVKFSGTPLPHREPAVVRAVLRDRLVAFAQQHKLVLRQGAPSVPRPLPWQPVTEVQWSWASDQVKKTEAVLFMNKQWGKHEKLTGCSHCHIENGQRDGLPVYQKTLIPERWYRHSVFNHGSHRTMACVDCHDKNAAGVKVAHSETTADILLPTLQTCQQCHKGPGAARNACVECHRYHER